MREKKLKRAAETVRVPQSREEAEAMLARLGAVQREQTLLTAALEETLASARQSTEAEAPPLKAEAEGLVRGIQLWAEANRPTLTQDGRTKTIKLATGEIAWRARPPSVKIKDMPGVMERLVQLGLARFLRTKSEINREAMLAEPSVAREVPGVTIASEGEEFVVSPLTEQVAA
jgi:phage host-nuclease inhibitor protein Gam